MRKLNNLFMRFFPVRFYESDQGAAGGVASPAPEGGAGGDLGTPAGYEDIPASAIESDPELKQLIEDDKKVVPKGDKEAASDDDKGPEGVDDNPGTDEGDGEKTGDASDDTTGGASDDLSDVEFEDDVIPGLKAEHLKTMPKEVVAALADFAGAHTEISGKAQKAQEDLTKLLSDPIVKRRMDLLKSGKTEYEVRGLNATERQSILKSIEETGDLSPAEAEKVFSVLEKGLDTVIREAANDRLQGLIQEDAQQRQIDETQRNGRQLFLELGKFNKSLAFKETDVSKFWNDDGSLNDKHPESKLFREKIVPLMTALQEGGQTYDSLVRLSKKFGPQAVYALAASHLGLPVAINTDDRDKKIVASELKKRLAPFIKKTSVLDTKGGSALPAARSSDAAVIKHGYDVLKLAEGGDYYDKAIQAKGANPEHIAMIDRLAEEGEALMARKQKTKK